MHSDDHSFPRMEDFVDVGEGEKSLVDPMQVDDICPLKLGKVCDVCPCIGNVHLKKVLATEFVGDEDAQAFPEELEWLHPVVSYRNHCEVVSLLVAHKHLDLDTIFFQGFHQTIGSNRCTTDTLRCIND